MKSFKEFLTEVVGLNDLKDIVFLSLKRSDSGDSTFLRKVMLPMSKKMSQRLFGERNRIKAAHITSESFIDELVAMQGTQKSLACMTNPSDPKIWKEGVATGGGIVFIVEGYPTIISNIDLYSRLDSQGRRFIPLSSLLPSTHGMEFQYDDKYVRMMLNLKDSMFKQIQQAQDKILSNLTINYSTNNELVEYLIQAGFHNIPKLKRKDEQDMVGIDDRTYGKIVSYAIKNWFDEMEKIWKYNWKRLSYIFDPEKISNRKTGWDEINLVDIKLIKCYPYSEVAGDFWGDEDDGDGFDPEWLDDIPDTGGVPIAGYLEVDMSEDSYTDEGWKTVMAIQSEIKR